MARVIERPRVDNPTTIALGARVLRGVGGGVLRYGLVLLLVGIGLLKFTEAEALAIQPWVAHSPLMGWMYGLLSVQMASNAIGVIEIVTGVLLAVHRWWPKLAAIGGVLAGLTFLVTLSFLFTTPDLSPDAGGFLMKDFMLFGAAIWATGESLDAAHRRG
jgi:uncharacterized membrane protein YkgB